MIALFFEVLPKPGHEAAYLEKAAALRPDLDRNGGIVFIDRFRSLDRPGWILSHQIWQDEDALVRWRRDAAHRVAQTAGRHEHFADYRLRVAEVVAEVVAERGGAGVPSGLPEAARLLIVACSAGHPLELGGAERFESVYAPGRFATVAPLARGDAAVALAAAGGDAGVESARLCSVIRDYGMHDRREAPAGW